MKIVLDPKKVKKINKEMEYPCKACDGTITLWRTKEQYEPYLLEHSVPVCEQGVTS